MNKKYLILSLLVAISLTGCASSVRKSIEYRNLHTETEFAESFFLDPFDDSEKNIFVHVANNAGFTNEEAFTEQLKSNLVKKGFSIVQSKSAAGCLLQVQLRSFKKQSLDEGRENVFGDSAFLEGYVGATVLSHRNNGTGPLLAGIASVALDSLVKAENYNLVSAIKVSTKDKNGDWHFDEVLALSHATQVNLSKNDASKAVSSDLSQSLASIFA